jgi:electron transfer flavoprotein beta subunit
MKIIVAVKQVPVRDSSIHIDASGKWLEEQDLSFEINEPDAYALETALLLKEQHGGEVIVLCAGPERAGQTIREALAKGADRAIHIEADDLVQLDTVGVARLLSGAVAGEKADLIVTGLQSDDLGLGQTGVVMAEMLGIPHATIVMEVEKTAQGIRVKRELEDGWFQWIEMPLPALLTIQSGISKLRYATLMGIKKAKTKEVRTVGRAGLGPPAETTVSLDRVYLPQRKKETRMIAGSPGEAAAALADVLKFEVRVL